MFRTQVLFCRLCTSSKSIEIKSIRYKMKNSFSIFIVVLFCAVLCVGLGFLNRDSSDSLGWNPNELYSNPVLSGGSSAFTNATISGEDVNNVGVAVSMRGGRVTSSPFHHSSSAMYPSASSSYAPAGVAYGHSSMSNGVSPIGHMTSSAEYHSFGGGHSGNMGSAMTGMTNSGNVAASFAYSSPSYGVASSGLSSYSPITLSSGNDGTQVMSAEQALISTSSTASGLFGSAMQNTYGTATYDEYLGMSGSKPSGVRGRQNATPGMGNGWWNWLDEWVKTNGRTKTDGEGDGAITRYLVDKEDLQNAYNDFIDNYWNAGMGVPPTFEDWWEWYSSTMYGGTYGEFGDGSYYQYGNYLFTPVGDVLPLVLLALMYMIILFVKRNKTAQL